MKVADIVSRVRGISGDNNVLQFSDDIIINWINDAMRECAQGNLLLQKTATSVVVNAQATYEIPPDILKLYSVSLNGTNLDVVTLDQAKERGYLDTAVGTPQYAWVWAGKLKLFPAPDNSTDTLEINYIRQPIEVKGEQDDPELPVSYHQRLVDYCLAQVAQQDDDMQRYELKMQEFRTGVQNLKDDPQWENNLYPMMSVSDRDWGYDNYYGEY